MESTGSDARAAPRRARRSGSDISAERRVERVREIVDAMRDASTDADCEAMRADLEAMYDEHGLPH